MMTKGLELSGNALKVIAIIAMTIDHLAWVGVETYEQAETPLQIFLHIIGRLTAPMMIFFVAEGYYHTHDFRRYLRRLMILAVVSHFAFCYFNMSGFNPFDNLLFNATSIAWPLMWGLILLKVWDMERLQIGKSAMRLAVWHKVAITLVACLLTFTSDWSCAAPLAILMVGRRQLPQADAVADADYLTLRRRLLHFPQPRLRYGPLGLLAGSAPAVLIQRAARPLSMAWQVLLLLLPSPHGTDRPPRPIPLLIEVPVCHIVVELDLIDRAELGDDRQNVCLLFGR